MTSKAGRGRFGPKRSQIAGPTDGSGLIGNQLAVAVLVALVVTEAREGRRVVAGDSSDRSPRSRSRRIAMISFGGTTGRYESAGGALVRPDRHRAGSRPRESSSPKGGIAGEAIGPKA